MLCHQSETFYIPFYTSVLHIVDNCPCMEVKFFVTIFFQQRRVIPERSEAVAPSDLNPPAVCSGGV